jgi:predicted glutamine amidotransferase
MCRLFGVKANRPVDVQFSLVSGSIPFQSFGRKNPHGWGLGWYENGNAQRFVEPLPADKSRNFGPVTNSVESAVVLGHVRYASHGLPAEQNCHPFQHGKWLFAHNGSVGNYDKLRRRLSHDHAAAIKGETDSEVYFHWLLQNIERDGGNFAAGVKAALSGVEDYTGLNFVLSDGENLYAYRNNSSGNQAYNLFYLQRSPSQLAPMYLCSKELGTLIDSKALSGEKAVLVCSEKLTDEDWKLLPLGSLLTVGKSLEAELIELR